MSCSALADLRRKGFTVHQIRTLLTALRDQFGIRLFDALGEAGDVTLLTDGHDVYAKTRAGEFFNLLKAPSQPLLVVGAGAELTGLTARPRPRRKKTPRQPTSQKTRQP